VRRWVNHFGPMIAAHLRKRRPKPHATWHLDEIYLKIDGRMVYLWRAVDAEVLDVVVQSKRNKHAALKLMRIRAEISLSPRRHVQHFQRPTPSHVSSITPCAPPRGDEHMARGRCGRMKIGTPYVRSRFA
jgi:hypothetical protein